MHKIGSLIAIFAGILHIAIGIMFFAHVEFVRDAFSNAKSVNISNNIYVGLFMGVGALVLLFGIASWGKARGFSSFILLGAFVTLAVFAVIHNSWKDNYIEITKFVINVVGGGTILLGMFLDK